MGLYDRGYYHDESARVSHPLAGKSMVTILIVINVMVFFANFLFDGRLTEILEANPDTIKQPWMWWKFLTYGFAHDDVEINHILFNMLGLFFFGRPIEQRLGRAEFLRFYLTAIVLGGFVWSTREFFIASGAPGVIGASGAVVAVTMLFVFCYPSVDVYLMMVLPVKAWVLGVLLIAGNLFGVGAESTAFDVHLIGIVFAVGYHFGRWNLALLTPTALTKLGNRGPRLRIHDPDRKSRSEQKDAIEADRILQKIHEQGEDSLTKAERKTLERHSRRLRSRK